MSEEVLKAQITLLKDGHNFKTTDEYSRLNLKRIYEDVLNLIEKQDKMIDMLCDLLEKKGGMIGEICDRYTFEECTLECKECIKETIRKKIEEENQE